MKQTDMDSLMQTYFEAVSEGDAERLLGIFTADVRWRVPQGAVEPFAGLHEGAKKVVDMMLSAVGESFVPRSLKTKRRLTLFGDDVACSETEMTAVTPGGHRYRNDYTFFFEFRDGLVSEIREHVDTRYAAEFFA